MKSKNKIPSFFIALGYKDSKKTEELSKIQKFLIVFTCILMATYSGFSIAALSANNSELMHLSFVLNFILFIQISAVLYRKEIMYKRINNRNDYEMDLFELIEKSKSQTNSNRDPYFFRLCMLLVVVIVIFVMSLCFVVNYLGSAGAGMMLLESSTWIFILAVFIDGVFEQILVFYSVLEDV